MQVTLLSSLFHLISLCLFALALTQSGRCFIRYMERPTYIKRSIVKQMEADFPEITFCSLDNSSSSTGLESFLTYFRTRFMRADENGKTFRLYKNETTGFDPKMFRRRRDRVGCYTYQPDESHVKLGMYYLRFDSTVDVETYVHTRGQFSPFKPGLRANLGAKVQVQVTYKDVRNLRKEIGNGTFNCGDDDKVNDPCDFLIIDLGARNIDTRIGPDQTKMYLYFAQWIPINEERFVYPFEEFVGEAGGYIGVLVGISALDMVKTAKKALMRKLDL